MSSSEPEAKEAQIVATLFNPSASAMMTINIYNRFVFNINLKPKETPKSEAQTHTH